jgi:hypothetical protein
MDSARYIPGVEVENFDLFVGLQNCLFFGGRSLNQLRAYRGGNGSANPGWNSAWWRFDEYLVSPAQPGL